MKSLLWVIPAILFSYANASAKIVDRVVAQVNTDIITMSQLNRETEVYRKELESKYSGPQLEQWIQKNRFTVKGEPVWARYNPPFTLWFMRRNEILIPITSTGN